MLDFIQSHGMIISGAILLIAYIFIASEKIQKICCSISWSFFNNVTD